MSTESCEKLNRQYDNENDYFAFYELPVSFHPDMQAVKTRFYALSKQYHPDYFGNASPEEQEEALKCSTLNNKAFQVLSSPKNILRYVLELKGVVQIDEHYQLPQSFLMEMMEVNEALMDLQFEPDAARMLTLQRDVDAIEEALYTQLNDLTRRYDKSPVEQDIYAIKDLYYRLKYINRLRERMAAAH